MNNIDVFFEKFKMYEDKENYINHKSTLQKNINSFISSPNETSAYNIYETFFSAYWTGIQSTDNPFLELLSKVKKFEENAGALLDKHRDHYVHTAHVFLTGLSMYSHNNKFRNIFDDYVKESGYKDSYNSKYEEFFYRWGIASLFHDIAYPIEISLKQIQLYFKDILKYKDNDLQVKISLEIDHIESLMSLKKIEPLDKHKKDFMKKYPNFENFANEDIISLLSESIHKKFNICKNKTSEKIKKFPKDMTGNGFIDHGFYSSIIILNYYHNLITSTQWNPAYFYFPIVDSASAILLHNFYKHILMKEPFNCKKMETEQHPIAFLLILCDELQEWGRKNFADKNDNTSFPIDSTINITDTSLSIVYLFDNETTKESYNCEEKKSNILNIINVDSIFNQGLKFKKEIKNG